MNFSNNKNITLKTKFSKFIKIFVSSKFEKAR